MRIKIYIDQAKDGQPDAAMKLERGNTFASCATNRKDYTNIKREKQRTTKPMCIKNTSTQGRKLPFGHACLMHSAAGAQQDRIVHSPAGRVRQWAQVGARLSGRKTEPS